MSLFDILWVLNAALYIFLFARKRDSAFLITGLLMGPVVWFIELYINYIRPKLKPAKNKDYEYLRLTIAFILSLLLAIPMVAVLKYYTGNIHIW
jgi:hypothetical protein